MSPELADRAALRIAGRCRAGKSRRKAANVPSRGGGLVIPLLMLGALAAVALIETSVRDNAIQPLLVPLTATGECPSPGAESSDAPLQVGGWPRRGENAPGK